MERRRFLVGMGALTLHAAFGGSRLAARTDVCPAVEHAGDLEEVLFVYDQTAAPHLLRQIVAIIRHLPADARVYALVSRARVDEAAARLAGFGLDRVTMVPSAEDHVSGDWGRDILQAGCGGRGDRTLIGVPWNKAAASRDGLRRTHRQLSKLEEWGFEVRLIPVAGEGGNMMIDASSGRNVLFVGNTVALETRALYRAYYGTDPGLEGVSRILKDGLGVDEVVWLGRHGPAGPLRQASFLFHIDMACTLVSPGHAVVARCRPADLTEARHREILAGEADRTVAALQARGVTGGKWPEGLELPAEESARPAYLEETLARERSALQEAADEMEAIAGSFGALGYEVHRLDAAPERVRRFQSHTNVIVGRERLIMPLYPHREKVHGWVVRGARGRDSIDLELGLEDSDFELAGDNLAAYELYRSLHPGVRTVRDYFYLAGGNVHCVIGRLS